MAGSTGRYDHSIGSVLSGRFRLDRLLGEGGMAQVYQATDLATGKPLAVKLLRPDAARHKAAIPRLRREAEVLSRLRHPSIVHVETFGALDDGTVFIAMELLSGETLGERLRCVKTMEPKDLADILDQVGSALDTAHAEGVVHRDLKPDNIFLMRGDEGETVKILDFGISKVYGSDRLTATGEVLGTPRYMAPEQLTGEAIDARVDVYAMGVIAYEAMAGVSPFGGANPSALIVAILKGRVPPVRTYRPSVPAAIEGVIGRAMLREQEGRFATPVEFAQAFRAAAGLSSQRRVTKPKALRTEALGSFGLESANAPSNGTSGPHELTSKPMPSDVLRPGTFSEFESAEPARQDSASARQSFGKSPAEGVADDHGDLDALPPLHSGVDDARTASSVRNIRHGKVDVWSSSSEPFSVTGVDSTEEELDLSSIRGPKRARGQLGWVWILVGALAAGAVVGLVLVGWLGQRDARSEERRAARVVSKRESRAIPPPSREAPDATMNPPSAPPVPVPENEPRSSTAKSPTRSHSRSRHRSRARRVSTKAQTSPPVDTTNPTPSAHPSTPAEYVTQARTALRSGNYTACVQAADQALRTGGSAVALRIQGDCLLRAGRRNEALAAYKRFCRLVPDSPALGEVRALAESLGGSCP